MLAKKAMVLGFDGMDPGIVYRMVMENKLPNFKRMMNQGAFNKMLSTAPPESPCAWASFATGLDPGGHGIFGFVHKTPGTYNPDVNLTSIVDSKSAIPLGNWKIPLKSPKINLNRKGKPFWEYLIDAHIEPTIFKLPSNFPPSEMKIGRSLSGMGTPDALGGNAMFILYTTDDTEALREDGKGNYKFASFDQFNKMAGVIDGPVNPFKNKTETAAAPFTVYWDQNHQTVRIDIGGKTILLKQGELSQWVKVRFELIPFIGSVDAITRFYLLNAKDKFRLYISAPSIDPANPVQAISSPKEYAAELENIAGPFHTFGLPADFNAIKSDAFDLEQFMVQADSVHQESCRLFEYELQRFLSQKNGMMFYYFSSIDQCSHIYWALRDPLHPAYKPNEAEKYGDLIEQLYQQYDHILGDVLNRVSDKIPIIVMSDHGFAPFRRKVDLNRFLFDHNYIKLHSEIDYDNAVLIPTQANWDETRAFAIGLNGLYLNIKDREPNGIILPQEKMAEMKKIEQLLLDLKDPLNGEHPVGKVYITENIYSNTHLDAGPDMIIGYNRNYALDSACALGGIGRNAISDNLNRWSGDHIIDPYQVPALLLTNFKITANELPHLWDLAPTILKLFGIEKPEIMRGNSLV
jgi:predicted AlkP superfamily phosphohydrolase/phosphomutase